MGRIVEYMHRREGWGGGLGGGGGGLGGGRGAPAVSTAKPLPICALHTLEIIPQKGRVIRYRIM
jgi:hypothetical protein